jgi:hypothetical protein
MSFASIQAPALALVVTGAASSPVSSPAVKHIVAVLLAFLSIINRVRTSVEQFNSIAMSLRHRSLLNSVGSSITVAIEPAGRFPNYLKRILAIIPLSS